MSKGGGGSAPQAPNPALTAAAQSASNVDTAAAQAALNNVNQFTPYGSTTYDISGYYQTPGGEYIPQYTQNTSLSPLGQNILTGEQGIASDLLPAAQTLGQQAASSATTPLNFNTPFSSTINNGPQSIGSIAPQYASTLGASPQLLDQQATDALYNQQKSFLDPQWNQQQTQLQDQLSRQGIPVGSEAYNNAMQQFNSAKTQAYGSAQDSAIEQGLQGAQSLFGLAAQGQELQSNQANQAFQAALQGQQQNISQQQLAQSNPLSLLQAMFGATPASPQQPIATPGQTGVSPTNVIGAQQNATEAAQQAYATNTASNNATFGGLASLAGAGILALSDERAKSVGGETQGALDRIKAMPVRDAHYMWEGASADRPMVMAHEVQQQVPDAVTGKPGGGVLQMVDFSKLTPLMLAGMQELAKKVDARG